jgi:hypothetical protein
LFFETDDSKFEYRAQQELDDATAASLMSGDPHAVAGVLEARALPEGPLWELPEARIDLFVALTQGSTQQQRLAALEACFADTGPWAPAVRQFRAMLAVNIVATSSPFAFAVDMEGDFADCKPGGAASVGFLFYRTVSPYAAYLVTSAQIVEIPLGGKPSGVQRAGEGLVLGVDGGLVAFRKDGMYPLAVPRASAIVDGFVCIYHDEPGDDRGLEILSPGLAPRASLRVQISSGWHPPPTRFPIGDGTEGWLVTNVVTDTAEALALCLFDDAFNVVATSGNRDGSRRVVENLPDARFIAEPTRHQFVSEIWAHRGSQLVFIKAMPSRKLFAVGDHLVNLDMNRELRGLTLTGKTRWKHGLMHMSSAAHVFGVGDYVILHDDTQVEIYRGDDGVQVAAVNEAFSLTFIHVRGDISSFVGGTVLLRVIDGVVHRTQLDSRFVFGAPLDDGVLLVDSDHPGRCVVFGADGRCRGEFEASGAQFSQIYQPGGPYVLEPHRLRIGALPADV